MVHISLASAKLGTIEDLHVQLRIQLERNEDRFDIHTDITKTDCQGRHQLQLKGTHHHGMESELIILSYS